MQKLDVVEILKKDSMQYKNLLLMAVLSFISMYVLMYIMVDNFFNVYTNYNQFYMAGLMTMPMIFIELFLMRSMYPNKKLNGAILLGSLFCFCFFLVGVRKQVAIGDKQFLKSMIPHHAAALLMCKEAKLADPEIKNLCKNIHASQQDEIDFMKEKLNQL